MIPGMQRQHGHLLWVVNVAVEGKADLDHELKSPTSSLSLSERQRLSKYFNMDDRYRGLVSCLLQRAVTREYLGVRTHDGINIMRTPEVSDAVLP
jgi:phosphopantetheinyl transferase